MTDVHFQPRSEFGTVGTASLDSSQANRASLEATEMAAFEKGRMQGEMEAIRRMEADANNSAVLKQFPAEPVQTIVHPDVVEINRLTYLQKAAAVLGELSTVAFVAMSIAYFEAYRFGFDWSYSDHNSGDLGMWNAHFVALTFGLFFLAQAILLYRVLPLNLNPWINKGLYIFNQACAMTCWAVAIVARDRTQNGVEHAWWGVDDWCLSLALFVSVTHGLYSIVRVLIEPRNPVDYETWAETNNRVTYGSPEQVRDRSTRNEAGRTVYAPAPMFVTDSAAMPAANANVGAQVPVAPANAPRWAENPNTHAENYFLLPRAKWAVLGYFSIGAALLMTLASFEHIIATEQSQFSQDNPQFDQNMSENSMQSWYLGSLGLVMLFAFMMISYAAMPPRTTLVKNGILTDQTRRTSISHTADTRLGNNVV